MGRLPIFAIERLPFAFETFFVAGPHPELRFLEMNGVRAGLECALNADAEKFSEVRSGAHVENVGRKAPAVTDLVTGPFRLRFVLVIDAVEFALDIILVAAPGNSGHDVRAIAVFAPALEAIGQPGINP